MTPRRIVLIALVALLAAVLGVCIGRAVLPQPTHTGAELHALLHDQLDLDATQEAKLETIEKDFANTRRTLEAQLRADNARLAEAIAAEHVYGPRVAAAVDASHRSMGAVQKATLEHVFAMRAILRPDQAAKFDAAVDRTLTAEAK
jgi:nickel and cobalt resistance protein CnrR